MQSLEEFMKLSKMVFGLIRYTIERYDPAAKSWSTIVSGCPTDADDPWVDPHPSLGGAQYRVTPFNADDVAGQTSQPR